MTPSTPSLITPVNRTFPFMFAVNCKALGSLNKASHVSVVGIFSYDGDQDKFHKMVELTMVAREVYKTMLENVCQELAEEQGPRPLQKTPSFPHCSQHRRATTH